MNTNSAYLINAILVLLVVRQIREHRLDLRILAVPVLAVGAAAILFLHSVPVRGNDIPLELICVSAGAVMGGLAGLATYLRRGSDGRGLGRAGWLAASLWITGVGARMAFVFVATHGAGPAMGSPTPARPSAPCAAGGRPPSARSAPWSRTSAATPVPASAC